MCKNRKAMRACIDEVFARCAGEVVSRMFLLFENRDEQDDLVSIVALLNGTEVNEFLTHSNGTVTYGAGPYPAPKAGARGIGRMFGADKAVTLSEFYAMA